jgi:tripartite-type tricarboxylate transporter receptor subunit TctC
MTKTKKEKKNGVHDQLFSCLVVLFLLALASSTSWAAEKPYPSRPIDIVLPYASGGSTDLVSRIVADKAAEFLGQPLISVYKPGGGGSLGASFVAKAKPDGYTVLIAGQSAVVIAPIVKKLDFILDDFIPAYSFSFGPNMFFVKYDARWKTLADFVEEARKFPGKLTVGSYGKLTIADFAQTLFSKYANIKLTHVPYNTGSEAMTQMLGGHIDMAINVGSQGYLDAKSVRALATPEEKRVELYPNVPTFKEFGYPVVIGASATFAFPRGTPKGIVDTFVKAGEKAFEKYGKEMKEKMAKFEVVAEFVGPDDMKKRWKNDYEVLYKVAEELGAVAK